MEDEMEGKVEDIVERKSGKTTDTSGTVVKK